jgi:hypothetical protein
VTFSNTSTIKGYGRDPEMADYHQHYHYLDIDCYPKIPYLVSQKEHLMPKEDLNYSTCTIAL